MIRAQQILIALALGVALTAGVIALYWVDPARQNFLPPCPLHALTGLHCPGCGATRAFHQLLHGNLAAAFHLNPLVMLSLPLLAAHGVRQLIRRQRGQPPAALLEKPIWIWSFLALLVAFAILRNLPVEPFCWLAPR